jgi:hypothetical protein
MKIEQLWVELQRFSGAYGITEIMGACFRDHVENFVADLTQRQHATMSMVEGEAWAFLHAMKEANLKVLDRV